MAVVINKQTKKRGNRRFDISTESLLISGVLFRELNAIFCVCVCVRDQLLMCRSIDKKHVTPMFYIS